MNVGIIIGRIGDVDGVALETEKWIKILKKMGHEVFLLSGHFKEDVIEPENQKALRFLSFFSPECEWEQNRAFFFPEQNRAFFFPPDDSERLLSHLDETATHIATAIFQWILHCSIDVLLVENASSLPAHLSLGMGIMRCAERVDLPIVIHHHDFYWERGSRYASPFPEIMQIVEETFPLRTSNARHAVINSDQQSVLKERFNIDAVVVPNVMDFDKPFAQMDSYNADLPASIGLQEGDLPLFQITRIVERKGIEVAIDLVGRLEDPLVKLVITGSAADDHRKGYYKRLLRQIEQNGMKDRIIFAHHKLLSSRGTTSTGERIFSLADAYAHAVACTYFSTYEGFGNAFVEAVVARRPVFVNNYKPVFWPDIGSLGFKTVMLEDNNLTDEAIHNPGLQREIAEHNFALGREHFSYEVLEEKLRAIFPS
jgi:glycosyltransferase involved in cell wall biosynthesis